MSQVNPAVPADLGLTVGAVARRLGVAPATLRTWDRRYGLGPTQRSAGSHRRYGADDLERLERMRRLVLAGVPAADAARAALDGEEAVESPSRQGGGHVVAIPGGTPSSRGLARAAQALDGPACRSIVAETLDRRGVVWTWDHLIGPVLVGMGRKWEDTGTGIEVEHVLSEAIQAEFSARIGDESATSPACVVLACVENELHSLPLWAVGASLSERHVSVRMLGARTPAAALGQALRRLRPGGVLLWSQTPATGTSQALSGIPGLRPEPMILLGGPGWECDDYRRVDDLSEAVSLLARAAGA